MKGQNKMKVIALKDFTDKRISLYEGEIRNIGGTLATQLITKGVCSTAFPDDIIVTPSSTSGTEVADIKINGQSNKIYIPASSGGGVRIYEMTISGESATIETGLTAADFVGAWLKTTGLAGDAYQSILIAVDHQDHVAIGAQGDSSTVIMDYNPTTGELTEQYG